MQVLAERFGAGLPDSLPLLKQALFDLALNVKQRSNVLFRLHAHR